jgi:glyoxylase I family protein
LAKVTGIGGFFFRSLDPDALNRWYAEHLGVVMIESRTHDDPGWFQERGETVVAACSVDSEMFGPLAKSWMINFRVDDLDGMVKRLRDAGIAVAPHADSYPNGRFAELEDPEGNRIQLWEPTAASAARDPGPPSRAVSRPT